MDATYRHLLVNHFSIILSVVGAVAAVLALLLRRRGVWLYATATIAMAGLAAVPAKLTGEGAEEGVEDAWFASRKVIHEHEEAGELAMWMALAAGAVGAFAWYRLAKSRAEEAPAMPAWLGAVVVVTAVSSAASLGRTAWEAGFILHRNDTLLSPPLGAAPAPDTAAPSAPAAPMP